MLLINFKYFFTLFFICTSFGVTATETKWEVAIVFRGASEDDAFQKDVDQNILELARTIPGPLLKLAIYRELKNEVFSYIPNSVNGKELSLGDILYRKDLNTIKIFGTLKKEKNLNLPKFLKSFFKDNDAKKALIIYSHGQGPNGLKNLSTKELKETLQQSTPHLDLLWLDACFMANIEFLYELRGISDYTVASEEAEFSSGLPFQNLDELTDIDNGREAAIALSKNFIESYSYLKNGSQRNYVSVSSATISIIENKNLENFVQKLKDISMVYKGLTDNQKNNLNKKLNTQASMDNKSLIDLGHFLIELRALTKSSDKKLTELIKLLNINAVKNLKTNPRLRIHIPEKNGRIVYGFNHWQQGDKTEYLENTLYEQILKNDDFMIGPQKKEWPYKIIESNNLTIFPFAPTLNIFNYYIVNSNGKRFGPSIEINRTHDIVESSADSSLTPLVYTAYTQEVGTSAERYTGMSITTPDSIPNIDYYEMEFNQLADWLSL